MNILAFDLECQNYKKDKRTASPFDERNYIVQIGYTINGQKPQEKYFTEWHRDPVLPDLSQIDILVGFNIKFDLLWVWQEEELVKFFEKGGTVFCGQYAEYLLQGMNPDYHMCSMNDIAEFYGGGCKIDAVKELWENGVLTADVPRDLLTDYLIGDGQEIVGDVMNTWKIFVGQVARMNAEMAPEFKTMLKFRMDGLLATTEMEFNGLFVNLEVAEKNRVITVAKIAKATEELQEFIPELPEELEFKWSSPQKKSCLIFGGTVSYKKWLPHSTKDGQPVFCQMDQKWPVFTYNKKTIAIDPTKCIKAGELYVYRLKIHSGIRGVHVVQKGTPYLVQTRYKGGKNIGLGKYKTMKVPDVSRPKGALTDHFFQFDGFVKPKKKWQSDSSTDAYDKPTYSVAAEVIEELGTMGLPFTDALSIFTKLNKILGTYYMVGEGEKAKGMMTLVNDKGIIHHKLNHTSTVTSRLSSSDPNLQNIPRANTSNVKESFESRFEEGLLAEIDYSQLEVVVQGVLTGDAKLIADLNNKIDFHCKRVGIKRGEDYQFVWDKCHVEEAQEYKDERTACKVFSFQRAYGAGAATIANDTGLSIDVVKQMVAAEEAEYPGIVRFDQMVEKSIGMTRVSLNKKLFINGVAFTQGEAHWDSPTGTRYTWREGIAPKFMQDRGIYVGFSPTERKNYPTQGFAGEIVQTMFGLVWRHMIARKRYGGKVLLCNTVHDCGVLDGHKELIPIAAKEVQAILEDVPRVFNEAYSTLNITVPFPCETEIGSNLYAMSVLH